MTNLIVMLTKSDMTIKNALEVFDSSKDLSAKCWGFKDNGITLDEMKELATSMKTAGKSVFFETLALTEKECISSANHAIILKADYMIGGKFFPSVAELLHKNNVKYFPYIGDIVEEPKVLMNSSPEEVKKQIDDIKQYKCEGVTLMAYENLKGQPIQCMYNFFERNDLNCIVAGNVNNKSRVMAILALGVYGFAIGSSFFKGDFDGPKTFRDQVNDILSYIKEQEG